MFESSGCVNVTPLPFSFNLGSEPLKRLHLQFQPSVQSAFVECLKELHASIVGSVCRGRTDPTRSNDVIKRQRRLVKLSKHHFT